MKKRLFAFLNNSVNKKFAESDIMHYDDGPHLDREWCINETKDLLKQLQEL